MRRIEKEIPAEYFDAISSGKKTYELRLADWDCKPGDTLVLAEKDGHDGPPTGRKIEKKVGHVGRTKDFDFWSAEEVDKHGYQIISLLEEGQSVKPYRYSPIQDHDELLEAIKHIHLACYGLCKQSFDKYLPNAGNVGVFCHYADEYEQLVEVRKKLTKPSDNPEQKYFELYEPIVIPAQEDVPETTYTHLYVREPDPYRHHVGDIDFYLEQPEYDKLKQSLKDGEQIKGARLFPRNDLDMVELYDPDVDVLGYVSTNMMSQKVRTKQSEETNL